MCGFSMHTHLRSMDRATGLGWFGGGFPCLHSSHGCFGSGGNIGGGFAGRDGACIARGGRLLGNAGVKIPYACGTNPHKSQRTGATVEVQIAIMALARTAGAITVPVTEAIVGA